MRRMNVPIIGFIVALLLPILGFVLVYFIMFSSKSTMDGLLNSMMHDHKAAGKVLTMSLLINLVPFVYTNWKRLDYAMRGIVSATMLYAVFIVLVMYVW